MALHKIDFWQEKLKMKVISEFIPQRLFEESKIESLDRIQLLNKCKNKSMLLVREICEKQLTLNNENIIDNDSRSNYLKMLIIILE